MRRTLTLTAILLLLGSVAGLATLQAASTYADPQFKTQWDQGEAITPNFWGPLATAKDGQDEPYKEASPGGKRTVQYFDKGRMELTNGKVTNGLLASEIIKGQIQIGDATFTGQAPPAIPIAGDPDGGGPTYAMLATKASSLLAASTAKTGSVVTATISATGDVTNPSVSATPETTISGFDDTTKHNVPKVFADYREKAGVGAIGYAISEPFRASVKVNRVARDVMVQVFERRALTYTGGNEAAFRVEMGNIGQHYFTWRYGTSTVAAQPTVPTASVPASPVMPSSGAIRIAGTGQTATKAITLPPGVNVLTFTHSGSRNFIVTSYDAKGNSDLLINEIGAFSGKKWLAGGTAYTFDIQADGAWSVSADLIGTQGGSSFSGKGFDVSGTFTPPTAPTAFAFTHTGRRNFIVTLNCDGAYADLIQNEIGQVSGSRIVRFPQGASTCFWEVEADGNWTIKPQA